MGYKYTTQSTALWPKARAARSRCGASCKADSRTTEGEQRRVRKNGLTRSAKTLTNKSEKEIENVKLT